MITLQKKVNFYYKIWRGSHISWFSCGSSILVELQGCFCRGRKTGEPGRRKSSAVNRTCDCPGLLRSVRDRTPTEKISKTSQKVSPLTAESRWLSPTFTPLSAFAVN